MYTGLRNVERKMPCLTHIDVDAGRLRVLVTKGDGGAGIRTLPLVAGLPRPQGWCAGLRVDEEPGHRRVDEGELGADRLHECRHTFVSTMIASGLNMKAVSVLAGHPSIQITADRHGHLFEGHEDEAGRRLDAFYATQAAAVSTSVTTEAAEA
jgi:hypothetical protein